MKRFLENPFKSFWMAGFESSDQLNAHGERVDFLNITSHLELIEQDYKALLNYEMKVVREGVRWSQVEVSPYHYDFSVLATMIEAGKKTGIQQVWDLCHFGFPDDLTPLHPHFTKRFESFCRAFALFYKEHNEEGILIVTPINEVGFISWLGGDVAGTSPYCFNNGWQVKYAYMRAYIAGVRALKEVDSGVRILTTEPLINVTCRNPATELERQHAAFYHELQFQVLDMLSGRIFPELGGKEEYLDLLGCNYYYNNQWVLDPHFVLGWNDEMPNENYKPLGNLLNEVYQRYNRPLVLSETSHPGIDRPLWINHIAEEAHKLIAMDVPLWGICWYPVIDRPDWDYLDQWHHAGLWDHESPMFGQKRILHMPTSRALQDARHRLGPTLIASKVQKSFEFEINHSNHYAHSVDS
jgi:hypothetical protein